MGFTVASHSMGLSLPFLLVVLLASDVGLVQPSEASPAAFLTFSSTNPNPSFVKVGDILTVNIEVTERLVDYGTVFVFGVASSVSLVANTSSGQTLRSTSRPFIISDPQGTVSVQYTGFKSEANITNSTFVTTTIFFDKTPPTFSTLSVSSQNPSPTLAKPGDTIDISVTGSEALQTPSGSVASAYALTATSAGSNLAWSLSTVLTSPASAVPQGPLAFTVTIVDLAGNAATATSSTDGSSVVFDSVPPTLPVVSLFTPDSLSNYVVTGGKITLFIRGVENLTTPQVSLDGGALAPAVADGKGYFVNYTLPGRPAARLINFTISGYADAAGNAGAPVTNTTDGSALSYVVEEPPTQPTAPAAVLRLQLANTALPTTDEDRLALFTSLTRDCTNSLPFNPPVAESRFVGQNITAGPSNSVYALLAIQPAANSLRPSSQYLAALLLQQVGDPSTTLMAQPVSRNLVTPGSISLQQELYILCDDGSYAAPRKCPAEPDGLVDTLLVDGLGAIVVFLGAVAVLVYFCCRKRRQQKEIDEFEEILGNAPSRKSLVPLTSSSSAPKTSSQRPHRLRYGPGAGSDSGGSNDSPPPVPALPLSAEAEQFNHQSPLVDNRQLSARSDVGPPPAPVVD